MNERFALFFPEKRPFFLEGIELFGSPQTLVYTRRIVNPKAGAKFTGKFGQLGVAHLTAVDETGRRATPGSTSPGSAATSAATRSPGVTFTNRDQGDRHNRVLAGDFRYVWGLYYTQFQYGASFTSDAGGQPHRADLAGGVRPHRPLVGLQLPAEGTGRTASTTRRDSSTGSGAAW